MLCVLMACLLLRERFYSLGLVKEAGVGGWTTAMFSFHSEFMSMSDRRLGRVWSRRRRTVELCRRMRRSVCASDFSRCNT